ATRDIRFGVFDPFQLGSAVGRNVLAHLLAAGLTLARGLRGEAAFLHLVSQFGEFLHAGRRPASTAERRGYGPRYRPYRRRRGRGRRSAAARPWRCSCLRGTARPRQRLCASLACGEHHNDDSEQKAPACAHDVVLTNPPALRGIRLTQVTESTP